MNRPLETPWFWGACPTRILVAALALSVLACGCGPSGPKRIRVRGKVTFDGNPPPGPGTVYFAPVRPAEGFPRRGGYGNFEKGDGSFVAGSVRENDGLVPGTYRVTIECWRRPPRDDGTPGVGFARGDYTPPELEIKADDPGPVKFDIDIPLRR